MIAIIFAANGTHKEIPINQPVDVLVYRFWDGVRTFVYTGSDHGKRIYREKPSEIITEIP